MGVDERLSEVHQNLAAVIRAELGGFSAAERRVARALLAAYPSPGLETTARLAQAAEVSAPTVLRFVHRLGFTGYHEFQDRLRDELRQGEHAPLAPAPHQRSADSGDLITAAAGTFTSEIELTLACLPEGELESAISALADPGSRVIIDGSRFSRLLAEYLELHLTQMRKQVELLPGCDVRRAARISEIGRRHVLVLFDYNRYEQRLERLARYGARSGAMIVLFTDSRLSPAAASADVVLPTSVGSPSPYDSMVPAMAVTELVIADVLRRFGERARSRLERVEGTAQQLRLL